jgi:hypothetical protein
MQGLMLSSLAVKLLAYLWGEGAVVSTCMQGLMLSSQAVKLLAYLLLSPDA